MADNSSGRDQHAEFQENDPFAELTRIMGHDPRKQETSPTEDFADPSIDLENELLGDLDLASSDEEIALAPEAVAVRIEEDEPAPMAEADQATDSVNFEDFDAELSAAFEKRLDDEPAVAADEMAYDESADEVADLPAADETSAEAGAQIDDFDFDVLTQDLDDVDASFNAASQDLPPVAESDQKDQPSLEEELEMLLGGGLDPQPDTEPLAMQSDRDEPLHLADDDTEQHEPEVETDTRPDDAEDFVPEIETVEMDVFEPARAEQLEVPDLPDDEPPQAAGTEIDDLTAELTQAFEFMDAPEGKRSAAAESTDAAPPETFSTHDAPDSAREWDDAVLASAAGAGMGRVGLAAAGAGSGAEAVSRGQQGDAFAMAMPAGNARARRSRGRGVLVAAAVVLVALLGGLGLFFLSSGGGSDGEPVLLQADADPVRVRPEDPGGAVVPNQDNEVYQRVAGGQGEAEPAQERLIDTAEDPVDLTAMDGPRVVGPAVGDDESRLAAVKDDERLVAEEELSAAARSDEFIALEPRRVRTMVVRPDGTIVPREETATAPVSEVGAGVMAAETAPAPELPQPGSGQPASSDSGFAQGPGPAEENQAVASGTGEVTSEEVALAPATPQVSEPQAPAATAGQSEQASAPAPQPAPAAPQPQQEQQVAAVDPVPAPSSATSEWSMQIASQPSAESAQVTYQDLARRYSSLLEGRGVNIVRANVEGRTYYRVRIPMASRDEAVNLCTRYQAAGGSCFVSR